MVKSLSPLAREIFKELSMVDLPITPQAEQQLSDMTSQFREMLLITATQLAKRDRLDVVERSSLNEAWSILCKQRHK